MFGLPAWTITLIITVLRQLGLINWAEKLAFKAGVEIVEDVGELKTYHEPDDFPHGKNGT